MDSISDQPDYSSLRSNVSFLGRLLGETIAAAEGPPLLELIERIRRLSKAAREGEADAHKTLLGILRNLEDRQLVPVARAFSQFLNLANIADQHHTISREMDPLFSASEMLAGTFRELHENGASQRQIIATVDALRIELVLTAHPTEITRRTLIHKHGEITACLGQLELQGLTERERQQIHARLRELIAQIWHGYDFRQQRPTPVEEAKWGFAVLENSLWQAVPHIGISARLSERGLTTALPSGMSICGMLPIGTVLSKGSPYQSAAPVVGEHLTLGQPGLTSFWVISAVSYTHLTLPTSDLV